MLNTVNNAPKGKTCKNKLIKSVYSDGFAEDKRHVRIHKLILLLFKSIVIPLIDFNSWLKNQRLLVGPDSMAGHLAAYLNIPVVSIFGSQNPELTKPIGFNVKVLKPNGNCKHNRKHWRLCKECINMVKPSEVFNVINQVLKIK